MDKGSQEASKLCACDRISLSASFRTNSVRFGIVSLVCTVESRAKDVARSGGVGFARAVSIVGKRVSPFKLKKRSIRGEGERGENWWWRGRKWRERG